MSPEAALGDPLAKRLLGSALDRLDRSRPEDRTNAVRIPIDQKTAPEIFKAETSADREIAWHVLDVLVDAGIGTLAYRRAPRHGSRGPPAGVRDIDHSGQRGPSSYLLRPPSAGPEVFGGMALAGPIERPRWRYQSGYCRSPRLHRPIQRTKRSGRKTRGPHASERSALGNSRMG